MAASDDKRINKQKPNKKVMVSNAQYLTPEQQKRGCC